MSRIKLLLPIIILLASCTKEVPETERKLAKSVDESQIRALIENFVNTYNSGDINSASRLFDENYQEITSDSLDIIGADAVRNELENFHKEYPEGKWSIKIDEIILSDGYANVICSGSFYMPDPVEKKMNPVHSERNIRILRKDKATGWKFYRYLSLPTFTFDEK